MALHWRSLIPRRSESRPPITNVHCHRTGRFTHRRLARVCQELQDDDQSLFRQNLIVSRFDDSGRHTIALIGRVLFQPDGTRQLVADADELVAVLGEHFGIVQSDLHELWPAVAARHAELFPDD